MNYFAMPGMPRLSFDEIIETSFGRTIESYKEQSRKMEIVKQRHLIIYYYHKQGDLSPQSIGNIIGRDRTTVIHSIETTKKLLNNAEYQKELNKLPLHIKNSIENGKQSDIH